MKPLKVALIHRDSDRCTHNRMVGIWSSPVPGFEWDHYPVTKHFKIDRGQLSDYDLIFYEDGKLWGKFYGEGPPIAYHVVDSTLSVDHYNIRRQQAEQCDLILLCHEAFERFTWPGGPPVRRLSHCINTRFFKEWGLEKTVDVSFHCRVKGDYERPRMQDWLGDFCRRNEWSYDCGLRKNEEYGQAFNRSKITVNWSRTELNRPHRVFDAMGCHVCLLTRTLPDVEEEEKEAGVHYAEFANYEELGQQLERLLATDMWSWIADNSYRLVHEKHTWPVRAEQLRQTLSEELGL